MEAAREQKAPTHTDQNELQHIWNDQDADLATPLRGDKLTLKSEVEIDEGVVVRYTDTKGREWVAVKTVRYALDREAAIRELQSAERTFPDNTQRRPTRAEAGLQRAWPQP